MMESMQTLFILENSKLNLLRKYVLATSGMLLTGLLLTSCSSPLKYENRSNVAYTQNTIKQQATQCAPYYQVVSGDTLSDIAEKCGVSMLSLARQNDLQSPYFIYVRQELSMPMSDVGVTPEATLSAPSETDAVKNSRVISPSNTNKNKIAAASSHSKPKSKLSSWQWPMSSNLEHRFIRDSSGLSVLEIYGFPGQEIKTVGPGKVVYAGNGIVNYGWMIVIKHDDDYMSIYAHNSALLVKEGDRVKPGQEIATLGATGNANKPKLYLEARYQGRKIDILKILKK